MDKIEYRYSTLRAALTKGFENYLFETPVEDIRKVSWFTTEMVEVGAAKEEDNE